LNRLEVFERLEISTASMSPLNLFQCHSFHYNLLEMRMLHEGQSNSFQFRTRRLTQVVTYGHDISTGTMALMFLTMP
jgi:hypothetical protein